MFKYAVGRSPVAASMSANGYAAEPWSDGETLWMVDEADRKAYAYAVPGLRNRAQTRHDTWFLAVAGAA